MLTMDADKSADKSASVFVVVPFGEEVFSPPCLLVHTFPEFIELFLDPAHGVMGRQIDPSWGGPIELFLVPAHGVMDHQIDPSWGGPIELFLVPVHGVMDRQIDPS